MILLIDNYDSFVHNLARYFRLLGQPTMVVRNDELEAAAALQLRPAAVVISPGPGGPQDAGISGELIRQADRSLPFLGVCLGHQVIAASCGAAVVRAPAPVHGRASWIEHTGDGVFAGIPSPFAACRYHSLCVRRGDLPAELQLNAWTTDGVIMGLLHRQRPLVGWQFHPESVLTEVGLQLCRNFLERLCGLTVAAPIEAG